MSTFLGTVAQKVAPYYWQSRLLLISLCTIGTSEQWMWAPEPHCDSNTALCRGTLKKREELFWFPSNAGVLVVGLWARSYDITLESSSN